MEGAEGADAMMDMSGASLRRAALPSSLFEAAARLTRSESGDTEFGEIRLVQGLARAIGAEGFRPALIRRREHLAGARLGGWARQPGRVDVAVVNARNEPRYVFEVRVETIEY